MVPDLGILHIEPFAPPTLSNVEALELEIFHVRADGKAKAPGGVVALFLRGVQTFPETPMREDPEEVFAEHDEACDVKDRVRRKMVQLNDVHKKKSPEEFMRGERKAVEEKGDENYDPTRRGRRNHLSAGDLGEILVRWNKICNSKRGMVK